MAVNYNEDDVGENFFDEEEGDGEGQGQGQGQGESGKSVVQDTPFHPRILMDTKIGSKKRDWFAYPSWTVLQLKEKVIDCELGHVVKQATAPTLELFFNSKALDNGKTLLFYGITSEMQTICGFVHLKGGAMAVAKKRRMDTKHPILKGRGSRKPDCINGEDVEPRAKLTCGCVFCTETVFNWVVHSFEENPLMTELTCPNPKCNKPVAWPIMACIAGLTQQEFNKYTAILKRRRTAAQRRHFTNCPFCQANVTRPNALNISRVRCPLCNKADFCFSCNQMWKKGGSQLCGNENCSSTQLQVLLDTCDTTNNFQKAKPCPKFRACPQCLQFVMYREACKHINCPNKECNYEFCLVCLNKYPCTSATCEVADRQKLN